MMSQRCHCCKMDQQRTSAPSFRFFINIKVWKLSPSFTWLVIIREKLLLWVLCRCINLKKVKSFTQKSSHYLDKGKWIGIFQEPGSSLLLTCSADAPSIGWILRRGEQWEKIRNHSVRNHVEYADDSCLSCSFLCHRAEVYARKRGAFGKRGRHHQQPIFLPGRKLRARSQSTHHHKV